MKRNQRSVFNFYESFSDLIFGTLIIFILLVLFLALNVREGVEVLAKTDDDLKEKVVFGEKKLIELERIKQEYDEKMRDLECERKQSELIVKKNQLKNKLVESNCRRLQNELNDGKDKYLKLNNDYLTAMNEIVKLKVEKNKLNEKKVDQYKGEEDLNSSIYFSGSGSSDCCVVQVKDGCGYKYAPIPAYILDSFLWNHVDVDMVELRVRLAENFFNNVNWFTEEELKRIFCFIKRYKVRSHRGKERGLFGFGVYNNLLSYAHTISRLNGTSCFEQKEFIRRQCDWKCIEGKLGDYPVLYFKAIEFGVDVNGVKMNRKKFIQLVQSLIDVVLKCTNGKIPDWVKNNKEQDYAIR